MATDASTSTVLAVDRTRLAHERTMMAWIRTAASLISFGFSIYKFFDLQIRQQVQAGATVIGPRAFALIMIGIGLLSLGLASYQHQQSLQDMRVKYGSLPRSEAGIVGILIAVMGLVAFAAVLFRM